MRLAAVAAIALALDLGSSTAEAQRRADSLVVSSTPSCANCSVVLERVATLRRVAFGRRIPARPSGIACSRAGGMRLSFFQSGVLPASYSSSGRFEGWIRGGLRAPESGFLVLRGFGTDSAYVLNRNPDSLVVFDPSGRPARRLALTSGWSQQFIVLDDGTIVMNVISRSPALAGAPLHVLDPAGRHSRSFGANTAVRLPRDEVYLERRLARANQPGRFWSVSFAYVIELWDSSGQRHRTLVRRAEWYEPYEGFRPADPRRAPPMGINAIWQDSAGLLWVAVFVPDREWARGIGPGPGPERPYRIIDYNRFVDTVVEVIDPETGRLVASTRLDQFLSQGDGAYLVGDNGDFSKRPEIHVWRARLSPPR